MHFNAVQTLYVFLNILNDPHHFEAGVTGNRIILRCADRVDLADKPPDFVHALMLRIFQTLGKPLRQRTHQGMNLALFVQRHLDVVFQTKIKRADRRLQSTEHPNGQLPTPEGLANRKHQGKQHRDAEKNPVNVIGIIKPKTHVHREHAQRDNDESAVIDDFEILAHPAILHTA